MKYSVSQDRRTSGDVGSKLCPVVVVGQVARYPVVLVSLVRGVKYPLLLVEYRGHPRLLHRFVVVRLAEWAKRTPQEVAPSTNSVLTTTT
jgi:hypothetical protein